MEEDDVIELGPFALHHPIGRGGMCEVWRGVHRESGVPIAVKVILHQYAQAPSYVRAFRDEVRAVAGLHHHNIVMVFDVGQIPEETAEASGGRLLAGSPFMVMELAQGVLTPLCGRLGWSQISWLLFVLLDGLAHAHARGVIHRDLKPGNILLVEGEGRVKITDFGLAHVLERETTPSRFQMLKGTPAYMAPEQFAGRWRDYGPWTDLYAFGCCVFALVCGRSPFGPQADFFAYQKAHTTFAVPAFPEGLQVPGGLHGWVGRLMHKDPDQRFQRAADAAWALREFCLDVVDTGMASATQGEESHPLTEVQTHIPWAVASPEPTPVTGAFAWSGMGFDEQVDSLPTESEMVWQLIESGAATEMGDAAGGLGLSLPLEEPETISLGPALLAFPSSLSPPSAPKFAKPPPLPTYWAEHDARRAPSRLLYNVGLGLFGLRTIPMVSREKEREELWQLLHEVQRHRVRRAIVLEGASGCGKSRLADWFCERAHEVGAATLLQAHHSPLPGTEDGLIPMLRRFFRVGGLSPKAIQRRLAQRLPQEGILQPGTWQGLTHLLTYEEDLPSEGAPLKHQQERAQMLRFGTAHERHRLIRQTIDGLCQERAVLVWLDDVQWGVETLAFVQKLLSPDDQDSDPIASLGDHKSQGHGVLVVMTAQREALGERPEAARILSQLSESAAFQSASLGALSAEAQLQLIQHLLGIEDALAQELCAHTQGNPLFAIQMLGDWVQRGRLLPSPRGFRLKRPEDLTRAKDLHQVWLRRITQVLQERPKSDQVALELAAALGQEVDRREWESVCLRAGIAPPDALVEHLIEQRLARPSRDSGGRHWSFVHGLLRESLSRQAQEEGRWSEHHRVCAAALSPPKDRYQKERIGRHLLEAKDVRAALPILMEAVRELIQTGDLRHAASLLDDLEAILETQLGPKADALWGELWLLHCQLSRAHGDYQSAGQWAQQTVAHARTGEWATVLGNALIERGIWAWRSNEDVAGAADSFQEAHSLACTQRNRRLQATSQRFMGALLGWQGEWGRAKPQLRQALDAFVAVDDSIGVSQCLLDLAEAERQSGSLRQAHDYAQRALHHLASYGNRRGIAGCFNILGDIERLQGHLQQAEQHYRDSQALNHAIGSGRSAISTLNLGIVLVERGHYQEATVLLSPLLDIFAKRGLKGAEGFVHACLLSCAASAQQWDDWTLHLQQAQTLLLQPGSIDVDVAQLIQLAAKVAASQQAHPQAILAYQFALRLWKAIGNQELVTTIQEALAQIEGEAQS